MIGHEPINSCRYELVFTGEEERTSERRTQIVISLTSAMMVLEIIAGVLLGSMALLADGWHMASHAAALGIRLFGPGSILGAHLPIPSHPDLCIGLFRMFLHVFDPTCRCFRKTAYHARQIGVVPGRFESFFGKQTAVKRKRGLL